MMTRESIYYYARTVFGVLQWLTDKEQAEVMEIVNEWLRDKRRREIAE